MAMKRYYDAKHKPMHFKVGDFVYLRLGHRYDILHNKLLTTKLAQRYVRRFQVLKRIGRLAYKLDLPESWRIYLFISVAHLEPAPPSDDPWNRQSHTVHTPTEDHRFPGETRYDVEAILAKRVRPARGRAPASGPRKMITQYLIR